MLRYSPRHQPAHVDGEAMLLGNGRAPYAIIAVSTTGCFATRDAHGQVRIHYWYFNAKGKDPAVVDLGRFVAVWACRAPWDASPAGWLTRITCVGCNLEAVDVRRLSRLTFLCCPRNHISRLDVSGLEHLRKIDCRDNELTLLDVEGCWRLKTILRSGNPSLRSTNPSLLSEAAGEGREVPRAILTRTSLFDL